MQLAAAICDQYVQYNAVSVLAEKAVCEAGLRCAVWALVVPLVGARAELWGEAGRGQLGSSCVVLVTHQHRETCSCCSGSG